jgi:carbamoyltransferase
MRGGPLEKKHFDIARSLQLVLEECAVELARWLKGQTGADNLAMAGGVALNCVMNARIRDAGGFGSVWVQPAAGDAGTALGAALWTDWQQRGRVRAWHMDHAYLGPSYGDDEIEAFLRRGKLAYRRMSDVARETAAILAQDKIVGWFQGRMEFGPRALGARSILGDARSPSMQSTMNLKIKFRESFRPFAPSVLREKVADYFELDADSPYMLLTAPVRPSLRRAETDAERNKWGIDRLNVPRSTIPAVTHVDYSARVQTVHKETNPRFHSLIEQFKEKTSCPVVVNTSFNVRGEPIVGSPEDAFRCFMGTEIEVLAVGNCLLRKERQDPALKKNYENAFELD